MEEPAIARTRRSLRSDLQVVALILSIAAWDASVVLVVEIAGKPIAFDWLPRSPSPRTPMQLLAPRRAKVAVSFDP